MSGYSRFDLVETSMFYPKIPSLFDFHNVDFLLDLINPNPNPFDLNPFFEERWDPSIHLRSLSDRITALEIGFNRAFAPKRTDFDRKYKWTAEISGPMVDRKYKWIVEAKSGEEKRVKWRAEIKGMGGDENLSKVYTFESSIGKGRIVNKEKVEGKKEKEKVKKKESGVKLVEIEKTDRGAVAIRKVFAKYQNKGKRKELSPQDAAVIIQMSFRSHLVRRSQVVRCLRDLAIAKAKLKEIRALFYNFSYRHHVSHEAEERQRFSEKIIVLLLTVDAIEGPDYMIRAARKSMVEELEYILEVVDQQPPGKLGLLRRRKFDLPAGGPISKEMAKGVAEVVQMLDDDDGSSIL